MYGLTGVGTTAVGTVTLPLQFFTGNFITLAIGFFLLAIVAALLGARGVAGLSMEIAKWLVLIFLVLAVVSLVL
ncbi:hypothetical protein C475_21574 [Halosimplex carlsbadense 2-9-1]|uniref:UPF0391 membrane protein C475_21574 n=1 Tax=Halosimplex carlsbadense 2-9-1 TaxID=797114 RepID=M0C9H3_9EURY|nr:DUF1328 family protein [Halosimplex carlsbadense]ELZ19931.1 hypothetical protein C475_21574 [Halosimplex carlsbadense 2-9-1]